MCTINYVVDDYRAQVFLLLYKMYKVVDTSGTYSLLLFAASWFSGFIICLFSGAQGAECCIKEGEAPDRGFSLPYTQGTCSELHIWLSCSFAVQLTTPMLFLRIYGNCTVLLSYSPWMKSSSKQGKLLTWMKRRWLQMPSDIFAEDS